MNVSVSVTGGGVGTISTMPPMAKRDGVAGCFLSLPLASVTLSALGTGSNCTGIDMAFLKRMFIGMKANAYYWIGVMRHSTKLYLDAIAAFEKAIALKPYHYRAYHRLGEAYKALEQHTEALAVYKRYRDIQSKRQIADHVPNTKHTSDLSKEDRVDRKKAVASNLFSAASDAFDAAYAGMESYTTRANHRYTILLAARSTHDADAYNEKLAGYTDPADFEPYTDADLGAHTAAIDHLATVFDTLTDAFAAFGPTDHLYKSAAAVYKATTALYVFATDAYSYAAHCAMTTALEGQLQAAKNDFEVMLLEIRAANATAADAAAATAKASAFKASTAKDAAAAILLEQKATEAQARAEALCAEARHSRGGGTHV